jgi:spermidine synthase
MIRKLLILIIPALLLFPVPAISEEPEVKLHYEKNSLYQYIAVIENIEKKERYIFNTKRDYNQGGIYIDKPEKLLFEYTQVSFISLAFLDRVPKTVLFVGLGPGSMPRYFHRYYPDAEVDVVEIDPDILDVAKKYFHFKETPKMKVHISDGRIFIKRTLKKYDMIFLDAYQNDYIPFHLTTVEFLREMKKKLKKEGVIISNIKSPFRNKFFDSMIETYKVEFPHLYLFKGRKSNNYIFIATVNNNKKEETVISLNSEKIQASKKFDIDLPGISWAYGYYTEFEGVDAKVLTDDFAPVNLYKHMKSPDRN